MHSVICVVARKVFPLNQTDTTRFPSSVLSLMMGRECLSTQAWATKRTENSNYCPNASLRTAAETARKLDAKSCVNRTRRLEGDALRGFLWLGCAVLGF